MVDDSETRILRVLREGPASSTDVAQRLGVSRQAAHAQLKRLVDAGKVVRRGAARATRYRLAASGRWWRRFPLAGLAEDEVFRSLETEADAVRGLEGAAADIVHYVVTELVNNAIDHSDGRQVSVCVERVGSVLIVAIEDDGIGVFTRIREHFALSDDLTALQELSKGKTTSAPERHTGEGLFFVSKAVDVFRLESGSLAWLVDNERSDMAIETVEPPRQGTLARAEIDLDHVRGLKALFDEYTQDYEFSKTRTAIRLFTIGVRFISRSEAKRLVHGLERFREVILDFRGVRAVGQGFADEVFRVWAGAHPEVRLVPVNMTDAAAFMVERARRRAKPDGSRED